MLRHPRVEANGMRLMGTVRLPIHSSRGLTRPSNGPQRDCWDSTSGADGSPASLTACNLSRGREAIDTKVTPTESINALLPPKTHISRHDQLTWVKKRIGERPGCADNSNSGTGERDVETTLKEPLSDYLSKVKAPY